MKLNNIPLELDNRISDIADIKTVITADENDVGKMGYFANSIHLFKNLKGLDGIKYGKLIYLSDLDYGGDKSDKCFVCDNHWAYRYFVPEDVLKPVEKKYRPYSLNEFLNEHEIGDKITYRTVRFKESVEEQEPFIRNKAMICGYQIIEGEANTPGEGLINLGGTWISLQAMFDDCETPNSYLYPEVWEPFGVKENE